MYLYIKKHFYILFKFMWKVRQNKMLNVCDLFLVLRTNTWLNCFIFSWDTRGAWINTQNDCHLSFVCHSCDDSSIGWDCVPRRDFPFKFSHKTFHFWLKFSVFSVQKHIYMSKHLQENAINQMVFERNFGNGGEFFYFWKAHCLFCVAEQYRKSFCFLSAS